MIKKIRGGLFLFLIALSTVFFGLLIIACAAPVYAIPNQKWRRAGRRFLLILPVWWMDVNGLILNINASGKLIFENKGGELNPQGWYMVVSNHQTWADILIISLALKRKIPVLKFFMKKELLWSLPVAGLACYILGYPFLERQKRADVRKRPELKNKDIETTKKACEKFKELPTSVISFAEGTRFTLEKKANQASPYENLLRPRAGGTAMVLTELKDQLSGVLDVTVFYDKPNLSLWDFACGNFEEIIVEYELIKLSDDMFGDYYEDRAYRARFSHWLNELWAKKDLRLEELKREYL